MAGRTSNAGLLRKLDECENPVTRSSLRECIVNRFRELHERDRKMTSELRRLLDELEPYYGLSIIIGDARYQVLDELAKQEDA